MIIPVFAGPRRIAFLIWCSSCLAALLHVGCAHSEKRTDTTAWSASPTASQTATNNEPLRFVVSFPPGVRSKPATGRALLFLTRQTGGEPRTSGMFGIDQIAYARNITNWNPGAPLVFESGQFRAPDALAYPGPLDSLEPGSYRAQALFDLDETNRDYNTGPGNLYSPVISCTLRGARGGTVELVMTNAISEKERKDTDWVKLVEVRSRLLSEFHGRETKLRAAVILPAHYADKAGARFPTLYQVPGFGGRHTSAWGWLDSSEGAKWKKGEVPLPMLRVILDPDVPLGHSVFANSANNGPVGDALVQELIPEIERRFRAIPSAPARFVTGHSSGGWSSLWLQVAYPDFFGGCWSTAPDPVDFRTFQTLNIYEDRNGHWTRDGLLRPLSRRRDRVQMTFNQLNLLEYVLGQGGQLDSFNAVFSPRGTNGQPRPVMDKLTGLVDRDVATHWKKYDIRRLLEDNWSTLGPKLKGKLHVIAGGWDTFYLNPATELLRDFLVTTDHGGYVEILPGDHGSFMTEKIRARIEREIADQFAAGQKNPPATAPGRLP